MKKKITILAYFAIFLFATWLLIFFCYLGSAGFSGDVVSCFSALFAVAHAGEFALGALLLMALPAFLPRRLWILLCVALGTGVTLYLLVDFVVYSQFRLHIDMAMLSMFLGQAGSDIFVFPARMYAQAAFGGLAALLFTAGGFAAAYRLSRSGAGRGLKKTYIFILICILLFHGIYAWARFTLYAPVTAQASILPLVQPLSLNSALKSLGLKPATDLPRFETRALKYPLAEMRFKQPEKRLNLVVIMLDGWRFDCMTDEISPNIYEFSREAQRFNLHSAGANHTRHGVFSFFYGVPGTYWDGALVDRISPVVMDALLDNSYGVGIFGSSSLSSPEFDQTVFSDVQGVDLFTEGHDAPGKDLEITNKFLRFLDTRDKNSPFFSFIFYDATHAYQYDENITPPKFLPDGDKNYFLSKSAEDLRLLLNRYKNTVRYDDALAGRVLNRLRAENLLENTVVIVTSDHGEEFDDIGLGYVGHNGDFSRYQTRVPMLVYWPGRAAADYDYPTSHMDVAPTLMSEIFGCLNPAADYSNGLNLFSPGPREYFFMAGPSGGYAIQVGDFITAFPPIGPSYVVSAGDYSPAGWKMPAALYRRILHDISRFKR